MSVSTPIVRDQERVLRRASWLSFWVGLLMLIVKLLAWYLTRSAAILSDAAESVVHIVVVGFVVYSLRLSQKPPDESHPYGHAKISFFSAGVEGALILLAGIFILWQAIWQWIEGAEPTNLKIGVALTSVALLINGGLGWYLIRLGKKSDSLILEANGHHVLTDAWTSVGVLLGLVLTLITSWSGFDPLCAILVSITIVISGARLLGRSADGLMDRADPKIQEAIVKSLDAATAEHGITWHHMRHRHLGNGHWVDFHLVFEDDATVRDAHEVATRIERAIRSAIGEATVVTSHLEPRKDHVRIHGHRPGEEPPVDDSGEMPGGER